MNKEILKNVGLKKEVEAVEQKKCPTCGDKVSEKDLRDELSRREYKISFMCQNCQDEIFFAK